MDIDPALLDHAKIAFASLCGGIVRLLFRPAESVWQTIWLLFACVTCGFYGTPVIIKWFDLQDPSYVGSVGALIGLVGVSFARGALMAADKFDLAAWIGRKVG